MIRLTDVKILLSVYLRNSGTLLDLQCVSLDLVKLNNLDFVRLNNLDMAEFQDYPWKRTSTKEEEVYQGESTHPYPDHPVSQAAPGVITAHLANFDLVYHWYF